MPPTAQKWAGANGLGPWSGVVEGIRGDTIFDFIVKFPVQWWKPETQLRRNCRHFSGNAVKEINNLTN